MALNDPLFTILILVRGSHVPIDALGPGSKVRAVMSSERKTNIESRGVRVVLINCLIEMY